MMKTSIFRKNIIAASLLTVLSATISAAENSYTRPLKELKIMSKIFETALTEQSTKKERIFGSKKTQATYLANQGMLFTFSFGRNSFAPESDWQHFGEGIGNLVGVIASEVGTALSELPIPDAPEAPDFDFEFDDVGRFEAYQERMEQLEEMRERQYSQREEVRALQREIRELERQGRRNSDNSDELDETKKELEEKLDVLNAKMDEYNKSMQVYRETRDKKYHESAQRKSEAIVSTLCDYGATLRSLKNDEHVTLIFKDYTKDKDQVFVFKSRSIKDCNSKEELLRDVISYQL